MQHTPRLAHRRAALTTADVRGNVVLVDFWTYTCINWLRTLAYKRDVGVLCVVLSLVSFLVWAALISGSQSSGY
jgi:hypothetical protein